MKLKKDHCYVIGYIDKSGRFVLPDELGIEHWIYKNESSLLINLRNMYRYKDDVKDWFLLESCEESEMVRGEMYYFLYDSFGDGLQRPSGAEMVDDMFLMKNYKKAKKKFDQYWEVYDEDQRCLFRIILMCPVEFVVTKKLIEVEEITVKI